MKKYLANASSDWGHIFTMQAVSLVIQSRFSRVRHLAQTTCRRRPQQITIALSACGYHLQSEGQRRLSQVTSRDENIPEEPCQSNPLCSNQPVCGGLLFSFKEGECQVCITISLDDNLLKSVQVRLLRTLCDIKCVKNFSAIAITEAWGEK